MHIPCTYQSLRKSTNLYSSENCFTKGYDQASVKDRLGAALGNRAGAAEHYNKSDHKWKRYLKALNKYIYIYIARLGLDGAICGPTEPTLKIAELVDYKKSKILTLSY